MSKRRFIRAEMFKVKSTDPLSLANQSDVTELILKDATGCSFLQTVENRG